jgi:hypothetical protein
MSQKLNSNSMSTNNSMQKKKSKKVLKHDGVSIKLNLKKLVKLLKKEMKKMKRMSQKSVKELEVELNNLDPSDEDNRMIEFLEELAREQKFKLSTTELSSFGEEFIPKALKEDKKCLEEFTNIQLEPNRSTWKNEVYKGEKDGKIYYIKTRELRPMTTHGQKKLEREIVLSKKGSELGLGPKIHKIFYCQNEENKKHLYIITEELKGNNLEKWKATNILQPSHTKAIKKLVDGLFNNNIFPDYIGDNNILVDDSVQPVKFYFNDFESCISEEEIIKERKENIYEELEYLEGSYSEYKLCKLIAKKLILKKIVKYSL